MAEALQAAAAPQQKKGAPNPPLAAGEGGATPPPDPEFLNNLAKYNKWAQKTFVIGDTYFFVKFNQGMPPAHMGLVADAHKEYNRFVKPAEGIRTFGIYLTALRHHHLLQFLWLKAKEPVVTPPPTSPVEALLRGEGE